MVTLLDDPAPEAVAQALRALARDVGDPYRMDDAVLARALGRGTAAVLAEAGGAPVGVAVYVVFPSTTRGRMGAFVTDLWVAEGQRGTGLGRRLLTRVRDRVAAEWGATFLRLNYFADNPGAVAFYTRLGFRPMPGETWVTLEGAALDALV
ncbi:GNAT family N-acetyltransferase [Roseicyclus persicicus]|uniref:GNAT family N-acetyltransferase n=1 Tax=Roseicyclus persicicus TaxID=2650661 RepID=A0A7X6H030_9RHOB|nr:GNAT family N-acetyltransferase [Roseibacterium persicicum]NKX44753.1 GNAT family N-acetyltransferase [Roseibacterium persicicum]